MMAPGRSAVSLLVMLQLALAQNAGDAVCDSGSGECADARLSEEGDRNSASRLGSIMSNSKDQISSYAKRFENNETIEDERATTDEYFNLATDFYEYGWGSSFHFGARFKGESLAESITRHEYFLSSKLGLGANSKVADLGMGVGGPLLSIAKFSGAHITGVTINDYQVRRAATITKQSESAQLRQRIKYVQGDFTNLVPKVFEPESLDAVYYIQSACHLSNRTEVFLESAKALKKGGKLFTDEWVMTPRFDPNNAEHMEIKKAIEFGNGIENLVAQDDVLAALKASGFKIVEHGDLVDIAEEWYGDNNVPWYYDIAREYAFGSISDFKLSLFGQRFLQKILWVVTKIGLVPQGALDTEAMLSAGARALGKGGKLKIFTPMYYALAEKL